MKVIFMGTPEFAVSSLDVIASKGVEIGLVISQPDKKKGRKMKLEMTPVKQRAIELDIKVYQPDNIKSQEAIDTIKEINPDLIVVTAYGQILPKEILDIPKHGCINVHASLLPKYRGASPINSAIINGDKRTGITTMFMGQGLDDGDIILKDEIEIQDDDNAITLSEKLAKLSEKTLGNTLNMISMNMELPRTKQDETQSTYCTLMTKDMGHIDYTKSADEIINAIRGLQPWPCAYSIYKDSNFKIFEAEKLETNSSSIAGMIAVCDKEKLIITTSTKDISVKKLQFSGKNKMDIKDFLRGNSLDKGYVLE